MNNVLNLFGKIKNHKIAAWIFIAMIISVIIFYPIIDANFLYYKRVSNRIDILDKVTKIDKDNINENELLINEYNSILNEISEKESNYINNIFIYDDSKNNLIKFVASSWMLIIIGVLLPFTKDNTSGKRNSMNIIGGLFILIVAVGFGYFGMKLPSIINVFVNVVIYQIVLGYLIYTIATFGKK